MRIASLVVGLLGGLFSGMLGIKWLSDAAEYKEQLELAAELGVDTGGIVAAGWLMLVALAAGIFGGVLAAKGKGKPAAAVMIGAGVLPAVFHGSALVTTSFLILAGLLALRIRP